MVNAASNYAAILDLVSLSLVLTRGSETDGTDIVLTNGDRIIGENLAGTGGAITIRAGNTLLGNGAGGSVDIQAGSAAGVGNGGGVSLVASGAPSSGAGGTVTLTAGSSSTGAAGSIILSGGSSPGGTAGAIVLTPGPAGAVTGLVEISQGGLQFIERAAVPGTSIAAGQGRLWVRNDSPSALVFTDDSGRDTVLHISQRVDSLASPLITGSAAGNGGTVDFSIAVSVNFGEMKQLRVTVDTGTCASATVQFYRDAARTDLIYEALNVDPSIQFVDRNSATMRGDDGSFLESQTLYGRIANNDPGAATFDVGLVFWG